ncbi:MAG TPA: hypothetical protein DIC19_02225 [Erysipelotrichaceae bacterium]|nr:hypothetical protein [Erysipelotrichaceae bacterium]
MRKIGLVLLVLLMSACTSTFELRDYDQAIQEALAQETSTYLTMNRDLFSYYLPVSIGRKLATPNSVTLNSHNQSILMSLDVVNILNQAYYKDDENTLRDLLKEGVAFYSYSDTFLSNQSIPVDFRVNAAKIADHLVLLILQTEHFVFTSIHPEAVSPEILYDMLRVARSARIAKEVVLDVYSKREVIDFKVQNLNMFAQVAPESGTVMDMIKELDENDFTDFDFNADENDPDALVDEVIIEE